ncbi:MAG: alpha/beta fold hydrolase [Pseudomonadota bacterium]
MTRFLLVHGSAHGAWCWDDLIPHLQAAGHSAVAIDLPSHGNDPTHPHDVTLTSYANAIVAALDEGTMIVAHSMAGFPATLAADMAPTRVAKLIYLCAHVPQPGKSIADMRAMADSQPLADAMIPSEDGRTVTIDPTKAGATFYHDVPADRAAWAVSRLCPQAVLPQATPYPVSHNKSHARHYIRCMDDRAIPPALQVNYTADWPDDQVTELPTSHSPFLSDPAALASLLDRIAMA